MPKANNMLAILWLLLRGKRWTAQQLADELEIHVRTVYRYIDALCESGVPVVAEPGHHGGYTLLGHFTSVPLFFDLDEQKALVHASEFAKEAGYPYGERLERALAKLAFYSNEEQSRRVSRSAEGFGAIYPPVDETLGERLKALETAVADGETLEIRYSGGHSGPSKRELRRIDPYGIVYWKGRWYVVAYCHLRGAVRSFRADRIDGMAATDGRFARPEGFSPRDYLLDSITRETAAGEKPVTVRVQGSPQSINDLCGHWFFGRAAIERSAEEARFRLDEEAVRNHAPHLLLSYGKSIRVLEPAFLKERLTEVAADLLRHHDST